MYRRHLKAARPFIVMHLACLPVLFTGAATADLICCISLYVVRMFGITGGFHRYFAHRSYETSRFFQFVLAWIGTTAVQLGPLKWVSDHRKHHAHSDCEGDPHSPNLRDFYWAHIGWFLDECNRGTDSKMVKDLEKFPELRWLDRNWILPPVMLAIACYSLGNQLGSEFGTSGGQMLCWGFFVSTVCLYHATFAVNSVAHLYGTRTYDTPDLSRNNFLVAFLTLGEGWHNNHHKFPGSERQGIRWWEIDIAHYILLGLQKLGLVWNIKAPPESAVR